MVRLILTEEKPKERKVTIKGERISRYFTEEYSSEEIEISSISYWRNGTPQMA